MAEQPNPAPDLDLPGCGVEAQVIARPEDAAQGAELVLVLGGDGTLLRAAELARPAGVPVLGINLGHVGFLAEAERGDLALTVQRVLDRDPGAHPRDGMNRPGFGAHSVL